MTVQFCSGTMSANMGLFAQAWHQLIVNPIHKSVIAKRPIFQSVVEGDKAAANKMDYPWIKVPMEKIFETATELSHQR
jgi:hypothetical protein